MLEGLGLGLGLAEHIRTSHDFQHKLVHNLLELSATELFNFKIDCVEMPWSLELMYARAYPSIW